MELQTLGFCPLKKLPEGKQSRNHTDPTRVFHGSHNKFAMIQAPNEICHFSKWQILWKIYFLTVFYNIMHIIFDG